MKVLVIIVCYKVTDLTVDCLRSVAPEIGSVPGMKVAVCENGTGGESARKIRTLIEANQWGHWCSLTELQTNLGFTGGNNVILRESLQSIDPPEYALLLNADTIVRKNAFRSLVDFMENHPKVGIAGSRLEEPDGTPQRSAFRFQSPLSEFEANVKLGLVTRLLSKWIVAPPVVDLETETDWVSGASMIVRRQVFEDIGLLDEGYFTYFDDIDFCLNARNAGWSTWYVPSSRVVHLVGQTTGVTQKRPKRQPSYFFEARRRYFLKNHGPFYALAADAALLIGFSIWRLRAAITGKEDFSAPFFLRDSFRHSVFVSGFRLRNVQNPALNNYSRVQPDVAFLNSDGTEEKQ